MNRANRWWTAAALAVALLFAGVAPVDASGGLGAEAGPAWVHLVERFFVILTSSVVAFGIVHVEIQFLHWAWTRLTGAQVEAAADHEGNRLPVARVRRFDAHQRIQHLVLLTSFIVLALTGIAQKFYRSVPFYALIQDMGGIGTVRLVHRIAGWTLIVDGAYHILYLSIGIVAVGRSRSWDRVQRLLDVVPNLKDVTDFFQMMGYYLGLLDRPPRFGRFSYLEKFDYWAVGWGMVIMAGSGVFMMLPSLGVDVGNTAFTAATLAAHSDEAILAVSWIVIVHMYNAHLAPQVFPFNSTIFTGYISVRRLMGEHPAEYDRAVGDWERLPADQREDRRMDALTAGNGNLRTPSGEDQPPAP